jgi:hypothetical protein
MCRVILTVVAGSTLILSRIFAWGMQCFVHLHRIPAVSALSLECLRNPTRGDTHPQSMHALRFENLGRLELIATSSISLTPLPFPLQVRGFMYSKRSHYITKALHSPNPCVVYDFGAPNVSTNLHRNP